MIWEVWYFTETERISALIEAASFDEALTIARNHDKRYCYGKVAFT